MYYNYNGMRSTFKELTPLKSCIIADQSVRIKIWETQKAKNQISL